MPLSTNKISREFKWFLSYVNCQRGQIDWPKSVFLQTQATHFETVMMTTVDEVSDKTKVADEFILGSVLLDCFTAELDE